MIRQYFVKFALLFQEQEIFFMVKITFPDGAVREYQPGVTALEIAKSISEGLAKKVIAASVNDQVWDATRPIYNDSTLKLLTWNEADGKSTFWHSSATPHGRSSGSLFSRE